MVNSAIYSAILVLVRGRTLPLPPRRTGAGPGPPSPAFPGSPGKLGVKKTKADGSNFTAVLLPSSLLPNTVLQPTPSYLYNAFFPNGVMSTEQTIDTGPPLQSRSDTGWWSHCDIPPPTVIDVRAKVQVNSDREVLQLVPSLVESINLRAALKSAEALFMRPWVNVRRLGYIKYCSIFV